MVVTANSDSSEPIYKITITRKAKSKEDAYLEEDYILVFGTAE